MDHTATQIQTQPGGIFSTLFSSAEDAAPKPGAASWAELVVDLTSNRHLILEEGAKLACPMFSPAEFRRGGRRSTADALRVHFGVLDLDHVHQEDVEAFLERANGLELVLVSSWSHGPGNVSLRALFPFSRPVTAAEWTSFWPRMNAALGGHGDAQCKNVDRAYFVPATTAERAPHALLERFPGGPLDVEAVLRMPAPVGSAPATRKATREELQAVAKSWKRRSSATLQASAAALRAVLEGEPWAEPGARDNVLFRLAGDLEAGLPDCTVESIAAHFAASVAHFPDFTLDHVVDKLRRQRERRMGEESSKAQEEETGIRAAIRRAFNSDRDWPYTEGELAAMVPVDKRWVIATPTGFFLRLGEDYRGPIAERLVPGKARDLLAPALSAGVRTHVLTKDGDKRPKSAQDLLDEYGSVPDRVVFSVRAPGSTYDGHTFTQKVAPLRAIAPAFNSEVDTWLRLLGGDQAEILLDWLATVTDLAHVTAGLWVMGPPGVGKNLLALGLARLWSEGGPIPFGQATGRFNRTLLDCPLVHVDEDLSVEYGLNPMEELKRAITDVSRKVEQKHMEASTLEGALRVIIGTNGSKFVRAFAHPTEADIAALDERILLVRSDARAREYLQAIGGEPHTVSWAHGDTIAAHVLWLRENRQVARDSRFLVAGQGGLRTILTAEGMGTGAVLRAIVRALLPSAVAWVGATTPNVAKVREDRSVWVNTNGLRASWAQFSEGEEAPEDMGEAVRAVTLGETRNVKFASHVVLKAREVRRELLEHAARMLGREEDLAVALGQVAG